MISWIFPHSAEKSTHQKRQLKLAISTSSRSLIIVHEISCSWCVELYFNDQNHHYQQIIYCDREKSRKPHCSQNSQVFSTFYVFVQLNSLESVQHETQETLIWNNFSLTRQSSCPQTNTSRWHTVVKFIIVIF